MLFNNQGIDGIANSAYNRLEALLGQAVAGGASFGVINPHAEMISTVLLYRDFFHNTLRNMTLPKDLTPERAMQVENMAYTAGVSMLSRLPIILPKKIPFESWGDSDPPKNDENLLNRMAAAAMAFVNTWKIEIAK
jgi:hypothetical protein